MKKLFSSKKIKIIIIILVAGVIIFSGIRIFNGKLNKESFNTLNQSTAVVSFKDIEVTITGQGTIEPVSMYDIKPFVQGTILEAPFNVGMEVKKGDLLFKIDDSSMLNQIEKSRINIQKTELSHEGTYDDIENLTVYAPVEGRIENFSLNVGEDINGNNSVVAHIINDEKLLSQIPFSSSHIDKISMGQNIKILVSEYMSYIDGIVTHISNTPYTSPDGAVQYYIEIEFDNPGIIREGMKVSGILNHEDRDIVSSEEGVVQYIHNEKLVSKSSGTIQEIYVNNYDWVLAGQKIMQLENSSLENLNKRNHLTMRELELSLQSQTENLEDYNITSPIDGTVIAKNYKAGDDISVSSGNTVLMKVADMNQMIFTINVDELDINNIKIGQKVNITCDALSDTNFVGEITMIPILGTSQNGVTTYPVEVTISQPKNLKPGMNVSAEIIVENKSNVLSVPMAAINKIGNRTVVYVKSDEETKSFNNENSTEEQLTARQKSRGNSGKANQAKPEQLQEEPNQITNRFQESEFEIREIVVGINNNNYIEVISGLKEGETVLLPNVVNMTPDVENSNGRPKLQRGFGR